MDDAPGIARKTATPTLLPAVGVILGKVFKILSDLNLADFALKWTIHIHKVHLSASAVKALVW